MRPAEGMAVNYQPIIRSNNPGTGPYKILQITRIPGHPWPIVYLEGLQGGPVDIRCLRPAGKNEHGNE